MLVENYHTIYRLTHFFLFFITIPISIQSTVSPYLMSLPTVPHYSQISHCFFFNLFYFSHDTFLLFYIHPNHLSNLLQPPYIFLFLLHKTCIQITHASLFLLLHTSYFHVIISFPLTGKHPPLTISLTHAPTFPYAKPSFI